MKMINCIKGDATYPIGSGNKVIVHICNSVGKWGKGFVMALSKRWEEPEIKYRWWYANRPKSTFGLGEVQCVKVEDDIVVANMISQRGIQSKYNEIPLQYDALRKCFKKVAIYAKENKSSIHMPRIGCGLAGGSWDKVSEIIEDTLDSLDVTVYDL